jgi:GntR family transcriptional regulator
MPMDYIAINKRITTSIYKQIATSIKRAIDERKLVYNDRLPTEKEVCQTFMISPTVVRMAYDQLILEGYIKRIKGKGTYVTNRRVFLSSLREYHRIESDPSYQRHIIMFDEIREDYSAYRMLKLDFSSTCFLIYRIIKASDNPVSFQKIYLPKHLFPDLTFAMVESTDLIRLIGDRYEIKEMHNTYNSINASSAEALLLNIETDDAIYSVRSRITSESGEIICYIHNYFPGEFTEFEVLVHAL